MGRRIVASGALYVDYGLKADELEAFESGGRQVAGGIVDRVCIYFFWCAEVYD